ncbi:hypothetical protein GCM10025784_29540 [Citricoccus nitrophenolicus]
MAVVRSPAREGNSRDSRSRGAPVRGADLPSEGGNRINTVSSLTSARQARDPRRLGRRDRLADGRRAPVVAP